MTKTITRTHRKIILPSSGFKFDPVNHVYTLDGKPLHGVTTVLKVINKPALVQWAANMAVDYIEQNLFLTSEIRDAVKATVEVSKGTLGDILKEARTAHRKKKEDAGVKGTKVHSEIEGYINYCLEHAGDAMPLSESLESEVAEQTKQFVTWALQNSVKFIASEKRLYSERMWTAGTADFVCQIEGKFYIGDVKTSSAIYPEYFIQASAYAEMAREMELYSKFDGVLVVNVPKQGGLDVEFNYDLPGNLDCFKACLTIHKQLSAIK